MWRQLWALWILGTALLLKLLAKPFVRDWGGDTWLSRLRQESLTTTPPKAWSRFEATSRCIGCGLCDFVATSPNSMRESIVAMDRKPEDALFAKNDAMAMHKDALAIAMVCPTGVGVQEKIELIMDNAALLEK